MNRDKDKEALEKAQKIIDQNDVDFAPTALVCLAVLHTNIEEIRKGKDISKAAINKLLKPVLELKSSASMFNYSQVGALAHIMLDFLEALDTIDDDVLAIAEAYQKSLHLIVKKRMRGNAENDNDELEKELINACKRYYQKQAGKNIAV